jgi:5-methylcytosine-specific restriction protein B
MADVAVHPECPFSVKTFDLLEKLHKNSNKNFYIEQEEEFKKCVEFPLQKLYSQVEVKLRNKIKNHLKIDSISLPEKFINKTFVYILKQETTDTKSTGTNFFITLAKSEFRFGLFIKDGTSGKNNFIHNFKKESVKEVILQHTELPHKCELHSSSNKSLDRINILADWFRILARQNSATKNIQASVHLTPSQVLLCSDEQLTVHIKQTLEGLFPLFLMATYKDPIPVIRDYLDSYDKHEDIKLLLPRPESSLPQVVEQTGFDEAELKYWLRAIERKKQVIFYGSPGTGKTFIAEHLARCLTGGNDEYWELVQFHPVYSYEDFIQGIRPKSQDGQLTYPLVPGRFLEFCKKAESREGLCVLIIDEINRANLAQVFGELMYLLEYRDKKIRLAGSSEPFGIPENVRIIGTMNTADRSIALVDHALRRRFAFIELRPNYEVLRRYHEKKKTAFQVDGLIKTLERLNKAIADKHYEIGISYFLTENLAEELEDIWQMEIEPYLEEYFYDQLDKVDEFRWDKIKPQVCL